MNYLQFMLTCFFLTALYLSVVSFEKRQRTRLETKCMGHTNYTYLRYRNSEKCWTSSENDKNYLDAVKSCQEQGALLGTIKTKNEITLFRLFTTKNIVWIGLDKINKSTFTWIDNQKPVKNISFYFPGLQASADIRNLADCAIAIYPKLIFRFLLKHCESIDPYICEIR
ncbi:uncharacterized protein LOC129929007 [Biomphalaria glabrata]|uniref:Uncharacterized protein LOC129929007 n=1 Tax=Biomphalaria glabrata TaxID=6526 RepID=A0A9W3BQI7_BIOGL|nr:uncharacterized protein LOC129929007 [Biomphalaria glabrata]XP_055901698.1 uncharacterized protein LOC129929007 [Biomphalaria glabrata]